MIRTARIAKAFAAWGRPCHPRLRVVYAMLAGDWEGAEADARWALAQGPSDAESPIGRYAAVLAHLVLGEDAEARQLADGLRREIDALAAGALGSGEALSTQQLSVLANVTLDRPHTFSLQIIANNSGVNASAVVK